MNVHKTVHDRRVQTSQQSSLFVSPFVPHSMTAKEHRCGRAASLGLREMFGKHNRMKFIMVSLGNSVT